ncbi:unnamed protein product [Discula destructiva]
MESFAAMSYTLTAMLVMAGLYRYGPSLGLLFSHLHSVIQLLVQRVRSDKCALADFTAQQRIRALSQLSTRHETASRLSDLIDNDGAGAWPPCANHGYDTWPVPLRGYSQVFQKIAPLLSTATASVDDQVNRARIDSFRAEFRKQLREHVDLVQVRPWLEAVEAERWDILPRDKMNAFWGCVALSRHAYRWATIPIVAVAQRERELDLPLELVEPWGPLQRHFRCESQSGNMTSNIYHNFDAQGRYMFKFNAALPHVLPSEENFMRIMVAIEATALPLYHHVILAIIAFEARDTASCAAHMAHIQKTVELVLSKFYNRLHDKSISKVYWLSYVQGIHAWSLDGPNPSSSPDSAKHDGLSGNQLLALQVLDGFLGLEPYLSTKDREQVMPLRQRLFCQAIERYSFRHRLGELGDGASEDERAVETSFSIIIRRLRLFRAAHRNRAHGYLSQQAPERIPMTAGNGLLEATMDESFSVVDKYMLGRLKQTV